MAAAKQQWASRQQQSQKQQAQQDAAAAAAAKLASATSPSPPPAATQSPEGQGVQGTRDNQSTEGGAQDAGSNIDDDEEQSFIAQRVQRSKHIADQLHRLHEESRRLQEQSRLLQVGPMQKLHIVPA
jgi:hypothetical protein